jgi:putative ABC transport system permease protein
LKPVQQEKGVGSRPLPRLNGLVLARGRFITRLDNEGYDNVAVVAAETAEVLFPMEDPLGKTIRIDENPYYRSG